MKSKRTLLFVCSLLIALFTLTGCNKKNTNNKISIVTTTNVYADIAKNIVGDHGSVSSIITNGASDPHDYEATTNDAKKISNADIIIANGLGYDSWMNKITESDNKNKELTRVGQDLLHLKKGSNPHIWYDLEMPDKYVSFLVNRLSKIDKKNATYYKNNGKKYLQKINKIKNIANKIDGKNSKPVFVSEPVFDYALQATHFKIANTEFENAIENETDPSPKVIDSMNKAIANKKIAFFVNNTQTQSSTIANFIKKSKKNNIPILNVRETIPNNTTYISWMTNNYENLAKIAKLSE